MRAVDDFAAACMPHCGAIHIGFASQPGVTVVLAYAAALATTAWECVTEVCLSMGRFGPLGQELCMLGVFWGSAAPASLLPLLPVS